MIGKYTITVFSENKPGILYRLADLFLRRKINIESLTVSDTDTENLSRFTIVVRSERDLVEKVVKQLYKIIEVAKVVDNTDDELVFKEIALIKVHAKNLEKRREIENLSHLMNAKIVYVSSDALVVEQTGSEEEIKSLYELLKPFGVKEFVRSGRISVFKENK